MKFENNAALENKRFIQQLGRVLAGWGAEQGIWHYNTQSHTNNLFKFVDLMSLTSPSHVAAIFSHLLMEVDMYGMFFFFA